VPEHKGRKGRVFITFAVFTQNSTFNQFESDRATLRDTQERRKLATPQKGRMLKLEATIASVVSQN
jgi:hypothetical protein